MSLIASLDIGSEKMVMAVAEETQGVSRLAGIKMIALQGVENGVITERPRVKSYIQYLLKELAKDNNVSSIRVALSGGALRISEHKVTVPLQKKTVKGNDLVRAENMCADLVVGKGEELVDMLPIAYMVDKGSPVSDPVGKAGKALDVRFRVYTSDIAYLNDMRDLFAECGIEEVEFFPQVRAYMEALNVYDAEKRFAVVDMGAAHVGVMLFRNGILEHETILPCGTATVEKDILCAFRLEDAQQAKKLKHTYGAALRSLCKNEKIQIPEAKKQIEKRDLVKVIQCRMEELLEGAVFQLQQWRFTDPAHELLLTGGGSRLADTDTLLNKLSGHKVSRAKACGIEAQNQEILEAPACLVALGLLLCRHLEPEEEKGGWGEWLSGIFR